MTWVETCLIPIKDRSTYITVEYATIDVEDGAFALLDSRGVRLRLPIGTVTCILLGPGTTITHAAVRLAADVRCLLIWIGESGVRLYSAGMPGGHRCDRLLMQAKCALDPEKRSMVIRRMYRYRFNEELGEDLTPEQMRGKEAYRVKSIYKALSSEYNIEWKGRCYDHNNWFSADPVNRCISAATSCLYGLCEAAILIAGYSPAIGFIHNGRPRSFVYDIADLLKYETVVPVAFKVASEGGDEYERKVRLECRDMFANEKVLERLVPLIGSLFEGEDCPLEFVVRPPGFSSSEGGYYDDDTDC